MNSQVFVKKGENSAWYELSDYTDKAAFLDAIKELGKGRPAFLKWDNIFDLMPGNWTSESRVDEKVFQTVDSFSMEIELKAFLHFIEDEGLTTSGFNYMLGRFQDSYRGNFESTEQFAEHTANELGWLDMPAMQIQYLNLEEFAKDLFKCDYSMTEEGNVFRV